MMKVIRKSEEKCFLCEKSTEMFKGMITEKAINFKSYYSKTKASIN